MPSIEEGEFLTELPPLPEDEEFCVYGVVYAKPEHADALEAVYIETTRLAQFEPRTIYYCITRDVDDPTLFHFFERYAGRKGFDEHNQQPIIQKLMEDDWMIGVKAKFGKPLGPSKV